MRYPDKKRIMFISLSLIYILFASSCTLFVDFNQSSKLCGNGQLDPEEICENDELYFQFPDCHANQIARCIRCQWQCVDNPCGNGQLDSGEECDDSAGIEAYDLPICDNNAEPVCDQCQWKCPEEFCGNGQLDFGEECDDNAGIETYDLPICDNNAEPVCDQCQWKCPEEFCGNGRVDVNVGEVCDGEHFDNVTCRDEGGYFCYLPSCTDMCRANFENCKNAALFKEVGIDIATDVVVDQEGNVYILGHTTSVRFLGQQAGNGSEGADVVVVKWDTRSSSLGWVKRFSEFTKNDTSVALAVDDNYVYVLANIAQQLSTVYQDVYVFQLDRVSAEVLHRKQITTSENNLSLNTIATSLRFGGSDAMYVTGYKQLSTHEEGFVYKLRRGDLGLVWLKRLGSRVMDAVESQTGYVRVLMHNSTWMSEPQIIVTTLDSNGNDDNFPQVTFSQVVSDPTAVSMDVFPGTHQVYVVFNYQNADGNSVYSLYKVDLNQIVSQYNSADNMEARRVRFYNNRVWVLGNTSATINNISPEGNSMLFIASLQDNNNQFQLQQYWVLDSSAADEAGGLAFDMAPNFHNVCISATAQGVFGGWFDKTVVHGSTSNDSSNMAVWCMKLP